MGLAARLRGSRFLRDSTVLQVSAGINGIANLASALALAYVLGPTRQGEFYLAVATWSFLWITVNLGFYNVAVSQIAAAAARDNAAKVGAWVVWVAKASLVIGVGASVLAWLAVPAFSRWAYGSEVVGTAAAVLALTPLLELPRVALNAALQGTRRMASLARVENGQELTRVFLVVAGALVTGDAIGPAIGMVAASVVGSALAVDAYLRELRAGHAPLPALAQLRELLRVVPLTHGLRLGVRVGLIRNIEAYGIMILPTMILGVFGDKAWVAYLRLAQRFGDVARTLMIGINRTALSHFSGLVGTKDIQRLEGAYWRATFLSGAIMSVALLGTLPFVPWLISFFPASYEAPLWLCYRILVPGVIVVSFSVANDTFYLVTNNLKVAVQMQVICLILGVGAMAWLTWTWPTVGAAIGLSASYGMSLWHVAYAGLWLRRRRLAES